MITVDLVTMATCALCAAVSIVYASWSNRRAHDSDQSATRAAGFARRDAEKAAAEDDLEVKVDHGVVVHIEPLRLVAADASRERLINAAVHRHPAGGAR